MNFSIEQRVEAVDQVGIWSPGQITAIENGEIVVRFDGYGPIMVHCPRHDKRIQLNEMTSEEIRAPTIVCSSISSTSGEEKRKKKAEENSKVSQTV